MRRHPPSDVAPKRRPLAGRFALGLVLASVTTSGVFTADSVSPVPPPALVTTPAPAIERVVPAVGTARTGTPAVVTNRPVAPVGDLAAATDPDAVLAVAGPMQPAPVPEVDPDAWFLVGDSTFFAAADRIGFGSAFPGIGFAQSAPGGPPNPLLEPPADFDGTVVVGVSVWDVGITDPAAYVHAVDRYRAAEYAVLVVAVPERYGPGATVVTSDAEAAALRALNDLVASAVGACVVAPWRIRDVEALGDVDGGDDHVHPTAVGVDQLFENLAGATDLVCPPGA